MSTSDFPSVAVTACTRQRPRGLARLLRGLANQDYAGHLRVVLVDNDPSESARPLSADFRHKLDIEYLTERRAGIPYARNTAIEALEADDLVAFVDDDETPRSNWLRELVDTQRRHRADAVTGPVEPVFEEPPPSWVERGHFFARRTLATGSQVDRVYTHNLLLTRETVERHRPLFDTRLAMRGGSDAHLAQRLHLSKCRMIWCQDAVCDEYVPRSRTTLGWLLSRGYRNGANRSFIDLDLRARSRLSLLGWGTGTLLKGTLMLPLRSSRGRHGAIQSFRQIAYGTGLLAGSVGLGYDEYKHIHGD